LCDSPGLVFPSLLPKPLQILSGMYPIAQVQEPYSTIQYLVSKCFSYTVFVYANGSLTLGCYRQSEFPLKKYCGCYRQMEIKIMSGQHGTFVKSLLKIAASIRPKLLGLMCTEVFE
jgi:hypothetical protein